MPSQSKPEIKITWDRGTGYDFLASLDVLHYPDDFGLRGAWAAGVRSRLPAEAREFLEAIAGNLCLPLGWIHSLAEPRDSATVLLALKRLPEDERLTTLQLLPFKSREFYSLTRTVLRQGSWDQEILSEALRLWRAYQQNHPDDPAPVTSRRVESVLNFYARPADFGRGYLDALQAYYEVFFSEEEKRIAPKLEQGLKKYKQLAEKLPLAGLLDEFDAGSLAGGLPELDEIILVPSYWYTPWLADECLEERKLLLLFGARPEEESLVPGEIVPEELMLQLKAMTDPTRLRILRYLLQEQITPAELARRLRLRAPTVTHHLHALKQAGMVEYVMRGKNEHLYFARMESIKKTYMLLKEFLEQDVKEVEGFGFLENERLF